ncbi:hypothetical protein ALUC_41079A [Aspergillus luchuensis]|nr:hypothetical protein ALUC_41079A [Aspergillus luchuensis]
MYEFTRSIIFSFSWILASLLSVHSGSWLVILIVRHVYPHGYRRSAPFLVTFSFPFCLHREEERRMKTRLLHGGPPTNNVLGRPTLHLQSIGPMQRSRRAQMGRPTPSRQGQRQRRAKLDH